MRVHLIFCNNKIIGNPLFFLQDARQDLDQSARPSISMQMNSNGAKEWRKLTSQNIGRRVAIVLDDFVYSAPFVQNEIPNGNSLIKAIYIPYTTLDKNFMFIYSN